MSSFEKAAPEMSQTILNLCQAAGSLGSISPAQAAQAYGATCGESAARWRRNLPLVRSTAISLAKAGRLTIFRKGRPADPVNFRGVYRLGLPRHVAPAEQQV